MEYTRASIGSHDFWICDFLSGYYEGNQELIRLHSVLSTLVFDIETNNFLSVWLTAWKIAWKLNIMMISFIDVFHYTTKRTHIKEKNV